MWSKWECESARYVTVVRCDPDGSELGAQRRGHLEAVALELRGMDRRAGREAGVEEEDTPRMHHQEAGSAMLVSATSFGARPYSSAESDVSLPQSSR
jgi:hypothetical protein